MASPSIDDYHWLVSDAAAPVLRNIAEELAGRPPTAAEILALRSSVGEARASLVFEQIELRCRARAKFSHADQLFFTRLALEQATDEPLAKYKAQRFSDHALVADLCCGIGGDAMALAAAARVTLIDRDPICVLLSQANVVRTGHVVATAHCETINPEHVQGIDAWHLDPDRRASQKRTTRVELGEPGIEVIDALRKLCGNAAIKLAPAAKTPDHWLAGCEREWIETRGECRQQVAWFDSLADAPGRHVATVLDRNGEACSFAGDSHVHGSYAASVNQYLFDPSPALLAAGLVGTLADALDLEIVSPHSLYLSGSELTVHPHLQAFAVESELPLDARKLKAYLQSRNIGRLEIKKRGVDVTPEVLRPQLDLRGDQEATLILARVEQGVRAFVCRRA